MKQTSIFLMCALFAAGCHNKRTPVVALPPAPAAAPAAVPLPSPSAGNRPAAAVPGPLQLADNAFAAGNYADSARNYEAYLQRQGGDRRDDALFRLALSHVLVPVPDWPRATIRLRQIVDLFPQSTWKAPAQIILSLQAELANLNADSQKRDQRIKQLTSELEKLKQIDADRRKKP